MSQSAIRSYQIQMCIRPELNPEQKHMTVMISFDILTYSFFFVCACLIVLKIG